MKEFECVNCPLLHNCHLRPLVCEEDILTPAKALGFKNDILKAPRSNNSTRKVLDNNGNAQRVASLEIWGGRNEEGVVIDPTKATVDCAPLQDLSLIYLLKLPFLKLFADKAIEEFGAVRKVVWSSESEARKDYLGALNDYISISWLNHLIQADSEEGGMISIPYIEKNISTIVSSIKHAPNLDRKLYKLGLYQGLSMQYAYQKSLHAMDAFRQPWHADEFIMQRRKRIDDGLREGLHRTKLDNTTIDLARVELLQRGISTQSTITGPLIYLSELYDFINPHLVADMLTKVNIKHNEFISANLGLDTPECPHHVNLRRPIPEMPALDSEYPGMSAEELKKYRKGSFVCPANHPRTKACTTFMQNTLTTSYPDKHKYPLSYAFAFSNETTAMNYSNQAYNSRLQFAKELLELRPSFYVDWQEIGDLVKEKKYDL